jgi:hypothetical protein
MKCKNRECNNNLPKNKSKFCSGRCQAREKYLKNKSKYLENARRWEKLNPEKRKKIGEKSFKKFRETKRERFNELMRESYRRNKKKWKSRSAARYVVHVYKKPSGIEFKCKRCNNEKELNLRFEIYPTKSDQIRKAIKKGKIYFLCKRCRNEKTK